MTTQLAVVAPLMLLATAVGSWGVYRAWFWLVDRSERAAAAREASSAHR